MRSPWAKNGPTRCRGLTLPRRAKSRAARPKRTRWRNCSPVGGSSRASFKPRCGREPARWLRARTSPRWYSRSEARRRQRRRRRRDRTLGAGKGRGTGKGHTARERCVLAFVAACGGGVRGEVCRRAPHACKSSGQAPRIAEPTGHRQEAATLMTSRPSRVASTPPPPPAPNPAPRRRCARGSQRRGSPSKFCKCSRCSRASAGRLAGRGSTGGSSVPAAAVAGCLARARGPAALARRRRP